MLILILIDVQYIQNVVFYLWRRSEWSKSLLRYLPPNKKILPNKVSYLPHWGGIFCPYPVMLFGKPYQAHRKSHCVYVPQFWTVNPAIKAWNYRPRVGFSGLIHCAIGSQVSCSNLSGRLAVRWSIFTWLFLLNLATELLATYKLRMSKRRD